MTDTKSNTIIFVETANKAATNSAAKGSGLAVPMAIPAAVTRTCRPFSLSIMVYSPQSGYKFEIEIEKNCTAMNEAEWKFVFMLSKKNEASGELELLVQIKFKASTPEEAQGIAAITKTGLTESQFNVVNHDIYPLTKSWVDEARNPTPPEKQKFDTSMRKIVLEKNI
jgi:hypothetical protein